MKIKNDQPVIFSNNLFVTLLLAAVIGLTGCKKEEPAEEAGKKAGQPVEGTSETIKESGEAMERKAGEVGEYLDDSAITAKIKAEMVADPLLSAIKIDVVTDKGVVKLSGVLNSQQSADRALEIARGVKGVKSVESNLVVSPVAK